MKRFLSIVISILLIFLLCSCDNTSYIAKGTYGENLNWTLDDEGTLVIKGKGQMINYEANKNIPWYDIRNNISSVVIKNGITNISDYAFKSCNNLLSVEMADSVTAIGKEAFSYCESLETISLSDKITSIGTSAFYCCPIKEIVLPEGLKVIEDGTFVNTNITSLVIPKNVTKLGYNSFGSRMADIYIPLSVCSIDSYTFSSYDDLSNIYYEGSEEQWENIDITAYYGRYYGRPGQRISLPEKAVIHYNSQW